MVLGGGCHGDSAGGVDGDRRRMDGGATGLDCGGGEMEGLKECKCVGKSKIPCTSARHFARANHGGIVSGTGPWMPMSASVSVADGVS